MNLIFLGPPGAGKGTQAQRICWEYSISQLSTGDLLRSHISKGTELGKEADKFIHGGNLVPDELIIGIIREELLLPQYENGYLLDGFPRTVPQAIALDALLAALNQKLDMVLALQVPDEIIIERLTARRTCPTCGKVYHLVFNPPLLEGKCDLDGAELFLRKDDNEQTVIKRLGIYKEQTIPIIDYYAKQNLIHTINGVGRLEDIYKNIKTLLKPFKKDY
ncbi:MAG: adenylate kinase [Candidatus Kapaibacteriota bacterium]|jgi:adenylate kinase